MHGNGLGLPELGVEEQSRGSELRDVTYSINFESVGCLIPGD